MELLPRANTEPAESLEVRVSGKTKMGDIQEGVYERLPDKGEETDEAFSRKLREALTLTSPCPHGQLEPSWYILEG